MRLHLNHQLRVFSSLTGLLFMLVGFNAASIAGPITLNPGTSATFSYISTFGSAGQATASFALSDDGKTLTVHFQNTSTGNTYLSAFGFSTSPNLTATSAYFCDLPSGANWSFTASGGGGIGNYELGASGQGNKNRLKPGQGGTLVINLKTPQTNGITLDVSMTHLTSLPDGSSQKPIGMVVVGQSRPQPPPAEVPEPATLLLVGSMLTSLPFLQRRRKKTSAASEPL